MSNDADGSSLLNICVVGGLTQINFLLYRYSGFVLRHRHDFP